MAAMRVVPPNLPKNLFREFVLYLLTLNCTSFMLCKPPFSLMRLLSSILQKLDAGIAIDDHSSPSFHPRLFLAPYMYLFGVSLEEKVLPKAHNTNTVESMHIEEESTKFELETPEDSQGYSQDLFKELLDKPPDKGGTNCNYLVENFVRKQEREILLKEVLLRQKYHGKTDKVLVSAKHTQNKEKPMFQAGQMLTQRVDTSLPRKTTAMETDGSPTRRQRTQLRTQDWTVKRKLERDKVTIRCKLDEIMKPESETEKICQNPIKLLGRNFLEKSLQQGLQIQRQLAEADISLRNAHCHDSQDQHGDDVLQQAFQHFNDEHQADFSPRRAPHCDPKLHDELVHESPRVAMN